jgi:hypothetical protein
MPSADISCLLGHCGLFFPHIHPCPLEQEFHPAFSSAPKPREVSVSRETSCGLETSVGPETSSGPITGRHQSPRPSASPVAGSGNASAAIQPDKKKKRPKSSTPGKHACQACGLNFHLERELLQHDCFLLVDNAKKSSRRKPVPTSPIAVRKRHSKKRKNRATFKCPFNKCHKYKVYKLSYNNIILAPLFLSWHPVIILNYFHCCAFGSGRIQTFANYDPDP